MPGRSRDGLQKGTLRKLIEFVCKKLNKKKSAQVIAEELEEDDLIKRSCDAAGDGSAYNYEAICKRMPQ